jgi:Tfp pilus assembly protein PilX
MLTRARHHGTGRPPVDERGSLIVALLVILVCVTLGGALVSQVVAVDKTTVNNQRHDTALEAAQSGVADALFRLDQLPDTGTPSSFCVAASASAGCGSPVATSVPAGSGVSYEAAYQPSTNSFLIRSEAVVDGTTAAVQATATRAAQYPFALFGTSGLDFNGSSSNGFSTYDDTEGYSTSTADPNPNPSGAVAIGSNGTISCNGGLGPNITSVYYTGGGGISGSCGTPSAQATAYPVSTPTAPSTSSGCPNGGDLGSAYGASWSTLSPGTYLCTVPVTISGTLTVPNASATDPVKLYVILPSSTNLSSTTAVTIIRSSLVNAASSYTGSSPLPVATALQILSNAVGAVGGDNGQGYYFGGVIDAPQAFLTGDGCKSVYYGALVINTLTCNGGPNLTVNYDTGLRQLYTPWSMSGYTDIPAALIPKL